MKFIHRKTITFTIIGLSLCLLVILFLQNEQIRLLKAQLPFRSSSMFQSIPPQPLPYDFYDDNPVADNYVSAKGTWESNLKLAYPYNYNEVNCWKVFNFCVIARAETQSEATDNFSYLNVGLSYPQIEYWGSDKIVASDVALCSKNTLTFDRLTKQVTNVSSPIDIEDENCKKIVEQKIQTDVLIDGSKKWIDEFVGKTSGQK